MARPERERELVAWFKELFASRTPPRSVLDAAPEYRVTWTETHDAMRRLGYTDNVVELRYEWDRVWRRHNLRKFCNDLMESAGEGHRIGKSWRKAP